MTHLFDDLEKMKEVFKNDVVEVGDMLDVLNDMDQDIKKDVAVKDVQSFCGYIASELSMKRNKDEIITRTWIKVLYQTALKRIKKENDDE